MSSFPITKKEVEVNNSGSMRRQRQLCLNNGKTDLSIFKAMVALTMLKWQKPIQDGGNSSSIKMVTL